MLDDLRHAAARRMAGRASARLQLACKRLLSEGAELNGMGAASEIIDRIEDLDDEQLDRFFGWMATALGPDPAAVLRAAQAYAQEPSAAHQITLTAAAAPPRQELLRRMNRRPGGTAAVLRLRRALLARLRERPEHAGQWAAIEADLLHLLTSWFNPGFLQLRRVDWNSPAQFLEKIIHHEAVHAIDGWDDLRRRLLPDRRCFAFVHPQLSDEPLIFVEVALVPEMPAAIAPLIEKGSLPLPPDRFRVAAFYSISNCEPGLRGVSLGNFLIKTVAVQLQRELPQLKRFCTLSPIPGFAPWLLQRPDFASLPGIRRAAVPSLQAAHERLLALTGGELQALQGAALHARLGAEDDQALVRLAAAYLAYASPTPAGDAVARFHLDNGARLERLNLRGNLSPRGLKQSFGVMVNYLYDLDKVEASHDRFRAGEVVRSRELAALL
ncbi:MAG: malonyl-CoA decarboxylase family protein [Rubrivivax sp.]|nr:malonyl-CoA decarboxylase family protein [Rubrivivax sp.]